jgi:hypothetical protein
MTREAVLTRTMVELADTLVDDFDITELLTTLSDRCVAVLDIAPRVSCSPRRVVTCG